MSSSNTVNMAGITATINTLLVDAPTQQTVNIGAGDTLRLGAVGGILLPPGADALTIDAAGSPGTLTAGGAANTAGELVLINNSSNLLTVNSAIADNGTGAVCVTKGGSGTLALEGANAYTGGTTLGAGILQLGNALALGAATASLNVAGGTLDLHGCNVNLAPATAVATEPSTTSRAPARTVWPWATATLRARLPERFRIPAVRSHSPRSARARSAWPAT